MLATASLALLLVGLGAILWGTKITLDNAVVVARHYRISDFFIGVAVLAVGSDLPELVVSIDAALRALAGQETANLIVGNAIGSCFGQIGLVMGVAGMLGQLQLPRAQVLRHGAVLVSATLLLMLVALDGQVQRLEGVGLIVVFAVYLGVLMKAEKLGSNGRELRDESIVPVWIKLVVGLAIVVASAELIVRTGVALAVQWGVDQSFIGIAIIGVGTSLPELVISIAAVLRGRVGLSVGNLIGSNILDTLLPVGISAVIVPLNFAAELLRFDVPVLLGLTLVVLTFLYFEKGIRVPQAVVLLLIYAGYMLAKTLAL